MSLQLLFSTATLGYLCAFMCFKTTAAKCNWINARGESQVPFGSADISQATQEVVPGWQEANHVPINLELAKP